MTKFNGNERFLVDFQDTMLDHGRSGDIKEELFYTELTHRITLYSHH